MSFWESFGIALIPALITAVVSGIISFVCAKLQNKTETEKIEREYQTKLISYKSHSIYDIKKDAILSALGVIDTYISWLNFDNNIEEIIREKTTPLEITLEARKCFNNLSITCNSENLINLFSDIMFKSDGKALLYYDNFRNEARKELGLSQIDFDKDIIFLGRVSTHDLSSLYEKGVASKQ